MRKLLLVVCFSLLAVVAKPVAAATIEFTFAGTQFIGVTSNVWYSNWAQTAYGLAGEGFDESVADTMHTWTYTADSFVAAAQAAGLSPFPVAGFYYFTIPRSPTGFDKLNLELSDGVWVWNNYADNTSSGGNTFDLGEFVVASAPPIPEPSTALLLTLGLAGFSLQRRRERR
ncbi:PEP-CTERM sorting domain-containing protein [Myxococcota bacterium]|nr:PEP-CTERM sorting domain-containing protein [Myxococcota bacterium]